MLIAAPSSKRCCALPEGAVCPVSSVCTLVSYSGMGIKVNGAVLFPAFVTVLARAKDAGGLRRFGDQSDEHVLIQHAQVVRVDQKSGRGRVLRGRHVQLCSALAVQHVRPQLLLGALTREDKAGKVTMVVERMFRVKDEGQVDNLAAERSLVVEPKRTLGNSEGDLIVASSPFSHHLKRDREGVLFANPGR